MRHFTKVLFAAVALVFTYACGTDDSMVGVESVSINEYTLEMTEGDEVTLVATIYPENATNKEVTWSSDNISVASVNKGVVKAIGTGTANITVKTSDGDKTATCVVYVAESLSGDDDNGSDGDDNGNSGADSGDVENVSGLSYTLDTPCSKFTATWESVENAVGYKCWHVYKGEKDGTELEAVDNGDGTWSCENEGSMYPGTYILYVQPIPAEGHTLKDDTTASIEIVIPKFEITGIYYRFLSTAVTPGVEYEDSCYNLGLKYMNIQYKKPERLEVVADNWYIYTTTPVDNIHHLEMWYGLYYDNEKPSIRIYSSTEPGVKQHYLAPEGKLTNGYWKVYYAVPEDHKYIYIEGDTQYDYLSRTSSLIHHWPKE